MSAEDHINEFQRIRAGDLANPDKFDYYDLGKGSEARTFDDMWTNKVRSAKNSPEHGGEDELGPGDTSLYESIRREGVRTPINVVEGESDLPMITEGHHRVFSAADIDPNMEIPVWWDRGR
jgi:hypothetical protein